MAVRFWVTGLLLLMTVAGCRQVETPGVTSHQRLLTNLEAELDKPPAEQDQEKMRSLVVSLRQEMEEVERLKASQLQFIEALSKRLAAESPTGQPPLPAGPWVGEVQFSFDTRPRDLDEDSTSDCLDVTVWPKDASRDRDTVKAVGTMFFVLSRQPPFPGVRGEVLQFWFKGHQALDEAWAGGTVFGGHHFVLDLNEKARQARGVVLEVSYVAPDGRELTAKKLLKL